MNWEWRTGLVSFGCVEGKSLFECHVSRCDSLDRTKRIYLSNHHRIVRVSIVEWEMSEHHSRVGDQSDSEVDRFVYPHLSSFGCYPKWAIFSRLLCFLVPGMKMHNKSRTKCFECSSYWVVLLLGCLVVDIDILDDSFDGELNLWFE